MTAPGRLANDELVAAVNVLAEFEWPVCPLGPWDSHFGAAALGNATDVLAHQEPLLEALYVQ